MFFKHQGENNGSSPTEASDLGTTTARSLDPAVEKKIEFLKKKWKSKKYFRIGEESTLMHALLFGDVQPIHTAILTDNIRYFVENCVSENKGSFLIEACLCGSRQIAEHILKECKISYKEHPDLLGYIAASGDSDWAQNVAEEISREKLPIPSNIFLLADQATRDIILSTFKPSNKPNNLLRD